MSDTPAFEVLIVEPATLLRRTVSLTLRSLGTAMVTDTATYGMARQLVNTQAFGAVVVALDHGEELKMSEALAIVQGLRSGSTRSAPDVPIALMAESCNGELLRVMKECQVNRIVLKPFRARDVIDTVNMLAAARQPICSAD